jgi:hypothetical protein
MVRTAQSSVRNWHLLSMSWPTEELASYKVEDSDTSELLKLRNTSVEKTV